MGRVDLQVNGLSVDAFVAARHTACFVLYLPLDVRKVCEAPIGNVVEFGPFGPSSSVWGLVGIQSRVGRVGIFGNVDKLENKGSTSDDATSSRQEVSAHNVLEYGGLASRLGTNDDLGKRLESACS